MTVRTSVARSYDISFEVNIRPHKLDFYRRSYGELLSEEDFDDEVSFMDIIMEDLQEDGVFHAVRDAIIRMHDEGILHSNTIIPVGWVSSPHQQDHKWIHADTVGDCVFLETLCDIYGITCTVQQDVVTEDLGTLPHI